MSRQVRAKLSTLESRGEVEQGDGVYVPRSRLGFINKNQSKRVTS